VKYAEGQSLCKCTQAAGVGYGSTAMDWGSFCRDLFAEYYSLNMLRLNTSESVKFMYYLKVLTL